MEEERNLFHLFPPLFHWAQICKQGNLYVKLILRSPCTYKILKKEIKYNLKLKIFTEIKIIYNTNKRYRTYKLIVLVFMALNLMKLL